MVMSLLERIRNFQDTLFDSGLARSVLALPAPRMMSLPAPTSDDVSEDIIFAKFVVEEEIVSVARDLFVSGFYNQAVSEAAKALDKYVQGRAGREDQSGTKLMDLVFSPSDPILAWSQRKSLTEKDEQLGYHRLFAGSMLGIRNPTAHEHDWVDTPEVALECIIFIQHLLRKAKASHHAGAMK